MVVAWGVDSHSIEAAALATDKGFVTTTLVGDPDLIDAVCKEHVLPRSVDAAAARCIRRRARGDVLAGSRPDPE